MESTQPGHRETTAADKGGQPGILLGALVGLLLTVPLVAIFYLADGLLGTPFVPFDVLDWLARNMPGDLITRVIDTMVSLLTALQVGDLSSAAKTSEQIMGISGLIVTGVIFSAVYFYMLRGRRGSPSGRLWPWAQSWAHRSRSSA
jgi:hypothetical protein